MASGKLPLRFTHFGKEPFLISTVWKEETGKYGFPTFRHAGLPAGAMCVISGFWHPKVILKGSNLISTAKGAVSKQEAFSLEEIRPH